MMLLMSVELPSWLCSNVKIIWVKSLNSVKLKNSKLDHSDGDKVVWCRGVLWWCFVLFCLFVLTCELLRETCIQIIIESVKTFWTECFELKHVYFSYFPILVLFLNNFVLLGTFLCKPMSCLTCDAISH